MTTTTLRAVTQQTVANCAQAAERALGAYQAGGHRLIRTVQRGVDMAARQGAERLAPQLAAAMRRASGRVGTLAAQGLDALSQGTGRAIAAGHSGVRSQVNRIADLAARAAGADNRLLAGGVQSAARVGLPGAQAALALSQVVVAGVAKLPGASLAAAGRVRKAAAAAPSKRRAKPAMAGGRADVVADLAADVAADVVKTASTVAKPVKALAKRTDKRVRKAAAPVLAAVKADVAAVSAALTGQTTPKARRKAATRPSTAAVAAVAKPAKAARTRRAAKPVQKAAGTSPAAA